jgi:hypothetical protein
LCDASHLSFYEQECIKILREFGAAEGTRVERPNENVLDESSKRQQDNMRVEFDELEMIDRIGAGTKTIATFGHFIFLGHPEY